MDWNGIFQTMREFNVATKEYFQIIKSFYYYLTNPLQLLVLLWNLALKYSFYVCMFTCLLGLIAYIIGIREGSKYARIAFFGYLTIQVFNWVM